MDMAALTRAQRGIGAIVLALAGSSATAAAQSLQVDPQPQLPAFTLAPGAADAFVVPAGSQPAPAWYTEGRACEGCPRRRVGRSLFQLTMVNVLYGLGNLARGQVTARVTPKTWWANMEQGWVWDLDDFTVNQFGHPYQGSNYFNTGRANGLNFYESAAMTAFGSSTWEYFGETNHASLNDFINTTLGGIALGEAFHRAAWLMRDTHATGTGRLWREIGATILDPLTGYNRFMSGDASAVTDKPPEMVPSALGALTSLGVLWRGSDTNAFSATGQPFLEVDLLYGDLEAGRTREPYDAMSTRLRFGGGSGDQRGASEGPAPGTATERRQAADERAPELWLREERCLLDRLAVVRGRARRGPRFLVAVEAADHRMGRPDGARRHRLAAARCGRDPRGGGARGRRRRPGRF